MIGYLMNNKELEQKLFDLDLRLGKVESLTSKDTTKLILNEIRSHSDKYQTNFITTDKGNGIKIGSILQVRIRGAGTVTGKISFKGQLLMINQSHAYDKDNDTETIEFKLKHRRYRLFNYNLPLGTYELHLWFWNSTTGERGLYKDQFEIVS